MAKYMTPPDAKFFERVSDNEVEILVHRGWMRHRNKASAIRTVLAKINGR